MMAEPFFEPILKISASIDVATWQNCDNIVTMRRLDDDFGTASQGGEPFPEWRAVRIEPTSPEFA
jgi:hypothetical protein